LKDFGSILNGPSSSRHDDDDGVAGRSASQDPDGRMNDRAKSFNANF
jgi:hypothetical protein